MYLERYAYFGKAIFSFLRYLAMYQVQDAKTPPVSV